VLLAADPAGSASSGHHDIVARAGHDASGLNVIDAGTKDPRTPDLTPYWEVAPTTRVKSSERSSARHSEDTMSIKTPAQPGTTRPPVVEAEATTSPVVRYAAAAIRLSIGWVFLWAFLDKLFGLGHETASKAAWIHGGSPTQGFLAFAATGPFKGVYHNIAGQAWADWLFMIGLLGIGVGLMLGIATRLAAGSGAVLLVLMWTAVLPPANNLFMDDHLIYAMALVLIAALSAGRTLGLGHTWERLPIVQQRPWLR
jgi:thiosulfate dehydrogenase [quinone] large subunit